MAGMSSPVVPCLGRCVSTAFLDSYGWEYKTLVQAKEKAEYDDTWFPPDPAEDDDFLEEDHGYKEKEAEEASLVTNDPWRHLVSSGIVVPPKQRTRQPKTEWSGPASMQWDCHDYMARQPDMNSKMRNILVDWIVEVAEEYKLSESTLHLAITLIDKCLACTPTSSANDDDDDDDERRRKFDKSNNNGRGFIIARDMLQCLGWCVTCIFFSSWAYFDSIGVQGHALIDTNNISLIY